MHQRLSHACSSVLAERQSHLSNEDLRGGECICVFLFYALYVFFMNAFRKCLKGSGTTYRRFHTICLKLFIGAAMVHRIGYIREYQPKQKVKHNFCI